MTFGSVIAQTTAVKAGGWRKVAGKAKNPKDFSGTPAVAPPAATRTHYLKHLAAQETAQGDGQHMAQTVTAIKYLFE